MKILIGFVGALLLVIIVLLAFGRGYDHHQMTMIEDCNTLNRTNIGGVPYFCAKFVPLKKQTKKRVQTYKHPSEFDI